MIEQHIYRAKRQGNTVILYNRVGRTINRMTYRTVEAAKAAILAIRKGLRGGK